MLLDNLKVLYLTRDNLQFYADGKQASKLQFSGAETKDLDVVDSKKLETLVSELITKSNVKNSQIILVLSADYIFEKKVTANEPQAQKEEIENFIAEIPFEKQQIVSLNVLKFKKPYIIAANRRLFEEIATIFNKNKLTVKYIVPAAYFGIQDKASTLSQEDIKSITASHSNLKSFNFLNNKINIEISEKKVEETTAAYSENNQPQDQKNNLKQKILAVLGIGLFILAAVLILVAFGIIKNPFTNISEQIPTQQTEQLSQEASNPSHEATQTSGLKSKLNKSEIKIQVLNGTGSQGQAGKVQTILENLGYDNIETTNAQSSNNQVALLNYTDSVSDEMLSEIKSALSEIFEVINSIEDNEQFVYNIVITTGIEK